MTEDLDARRRRAAYRASHRGTKEMDVMIGRFADTAVARMDWEGLALFERFLAIPDPVLQGWLLHSAASSDTEFAGLVEAIRKFHGLSSESPANG